MDEIEYKLKTKNSVLIVNAIEKLISTIKSKYKPGERQKFVVENEELKYLREKCSSEDSIVSLTACQGLLALVELGVLEIAHTMSTVVTLLPITHNYSAIISTIAGLLILDLKSRLTPGQPYKCQFSLQSPQHPFITVLEKNKEVEDEILTQMQALCNHPEYIVSSNSLELLRPVFLWLTCSPQSHGIRPWQLLLSLPETAAQSTLLLTCISCQQICNSKQIEQAYAAYSVVCDAAIYQQRREHVMAFLPMLARVCGELVNHNRDPRGCYNLIERCFALDAPELKVVAGFTVMLLAKNLINTSALYLHELFNLCLNIISKYEYSNICLSSFVGLSLQWLHLPSYLTNKALKVASKILDIHQNDQKIETGFYIANLKANRIFQIFLYTDKDLYMHFKLLEMWEKGRDNPEQLKSWFDCLTESDDDMKLELLVFFVGVAMFSEDEEINLKAIKAIIDLVRVKKEISVSVLPVLMYKIANDKRPNVKLECLRGLPLMATTKENVPALVSVLNKLKANKGVPTSLLIMLYTSLAETQVRCFPYLLELLVDTTTRPDELKWEIDVAKAVAVKRICEIRPSTNGLELVSVISSLLNRCSERGGAAAAGAALAALAALWRGRAVAPPGAWRALQPRLARDARPRVQLSLCELLSEIPALRVDTAEYAALLAAAAAKLWQLVAAGDQPAVVRAACRALACYNVEDYTLKDIPEIYRRTVKLPPSFCKTPIDAARKPEDVLDYVPCEIWPEVFRSTNEEALDGVQQLAAALLERELRGFRSGVYQQPREPPAPGYLPPASVARGLLDAFRRQVVSPTGEYSEAALLAMLAALAAEYCRPLPPLELGFLREALRRGAAWRGGALRLAARQARGAAAARRLLDEFLLGVAAGTCDQSDIMLFFENLPILCRTMPPNSIRPALERCLADSFSRDSKDPEDLFIKQLAIIRESLESDKIHDANRTLLSQIVENYFSVIEDDHVAWPAYVETCCALSTKYLERMTSPSGWWEVSGALLRKAGAVRSRLAALPAASPAAPPLVWLNEAIDAYVGCITEQEYSLRCMWAALRRAGAAAARAWLLQLLARAQLALNETEEESAKQYLMDVFSLAVLAFSGLWRLEPAPQPRPGAARAALPAAAAALAARPGWDACTPQLLEWLLHTRAPGGGRALLALRHAPAFAAQRVWARIEMNVDSSAIAMEDE